MHCTPWIASPLDRVPEMCKRLRRWAWTSGSSCNCILRKSITPRLDARLVAVSHAAHELARAGGELPSPAGAEGGAGWQAADAARALSAGIYSANLVRLEEKKEAKQAASLTNVSAKHSAGHVGHSTLANSSLNAVNPAMHRRRSPKQGADSGDAITDFDRRQRGMLIDQLTAFDPGTRMSRILALPPEQQSDWRADCPSRNVRLCWPDCRPSNAKP